MHRAHAFRLMFLFLLSGLLLPVAAHAQTEQMLWRIGQPDLSYDEFAIARHFERFAQAFPGDIKYEVGQSTWAKDWPYAHPGPADFWGGGRARPFEIGFQLNDPPTGVYWLQADLVDTQMDMPPTLTLSVNGQTSDSVPLARGAGERTINDPKGGRKQVARYLILGSLLHQGHNTLTLTNTKNSWLAYDCVTLTQRARVQAAENLSLKSTVFFKQRGRDLKQVLALTMDLYKDNLTGARATIQSKDWRVEQALTGLTPGARRELQFEVPALERPTSASLTLALGDQTFTTRTLLQPQKRWKFYILPQSHFDLGYTGLQEDCLKVHRGNTEQAVSWMDTHPDFAWTMESKLAEDYLQNGKRPADFLRYARQGRFGVQGMYANIMTGLCSGEELSHTIDFYDFLRKTQGVESRCMTMSDVPSMAGTVPMILNGHGIKYLSLGGNPFRGPLRVDDYETPLYWEGLDGSRVLMWKGLNLLGIVPKPRQHQATPEAFDELLARYLVRQDYPFDALLLHGFYTDNSTIDEGVARIATDWNAQYAYPKLIECGGAAFFEYIEKNFAGRIKTYRGDGGAFWEDGAGSSAFESGETRVARERLSTTEKLAALAGPADEPFKTGLAEAWKNIILYDGHTWGDGNSVYDPFTTMTLAQWAGKKKFADDGARQAGELLKQAAGRFAATLSPAADSVMVFNPSSWTRDEQVDFQGPDGRWRTLRAEAVPALGTKLFPLSQAQPLEDQAAAASQTMENQYYAVTFDPRSGAIASLRDKQLGRELLDASTYRGNEYVVATGAEGSRILRGFSADLPEPKLRINRCTSPTFTRVDRPGRQVMKVTSTPPLGRSFSAEVILYSGQKRIDFINTLDKDANLGKEAGYFAFPLAFQNPRVRLEIPAGVIRPNDDQFAGACKDWFCVQHFLTVADDQCAVALSPIDSPLVTLQDINRGQWYPDLPLKNGNVFAYVFNNYWDTNYRASQGEPPTFRFALTSAPVLSDFAAKQFGEAAQAPLVCQVVSGRANTQSPAPGGSVSIKGDGVVVQALKPARFGAGTALVLRELNGQPARVRVEAPGLHFKTAYLANLAEDKIKRLPVRDGAFEAPCPALGLATVILEP